MPKCSLKVSAIVNRPLSSDMIMVIGNQLEYTISDTLSMVNGNVENSVSIDFHDIEKQELYRVWLNIYMFLKSVSLKPEHHCAYLSWPGEVYNSCIWSFYGSICPNKCSSKMV